ncbi:MAG: ABC transporter ATP-binding protein [Planctomycetota bacterium]|jgi:ABC-type Fe3+/spermidine/putrescine transport system ATPase subunit
MASGVTFEGVAKRFGSAEAIRDLNLQIEAGTRLALLGPSGCGKTTTLRMLAGIETPDAGRILINGRTVNDPRPIVVPAKRGVGMVFQSLALWPHMTVEKNLLFVQGSRNGKEKARQLLAMVDLEGKADAYPYELSGGEQQRIALARALMTEPEILLMDEPMANLDEELKRELLASIRGIQEKFKVTMIYVTHDQMEALSVGERLAVMKAGRIHQVGSPLDVYYKPADSFVAQFIGRNNILEGTLENDRFQCPAGEFPADAGGGSGTVFAALRAEDLVLKEEPEGPLTVKTCAFQGGKYVIELAVQDLTLTAESREPLVEGCRVAAQAFRPVSLLPSP